jgi:hypothetical protein
MDALSTCFGISTVDFRPTCVFIASRPRNTPWRFTAIAEMIQSTWAYFGADAKAKVLFGMQNSCYVKLKRTPDWQRRSRGKDGEQDGHRSHVADRIQTADTVESAT